MRQLYRLLIFIGLSTLTFMAPQADDYDRLDGTGASKVKIDGIEWQDSDTGQMQFEFHAYPKGSLIGLGVKVDRSKKDKPVLVAMFKLAGGQVYIRRYILGFELKDEPHSYTAASDPDYTKIVLSNSPINLKGYAKLTLEAPPTQLYPDGHPMLAKKEEEPKSPAPVSTPAQPSRAPASVSKKSSSPPLPDSEESSLNSLFR